MYEDRSKKRRISKFRRSPDDELHRDDVIVVDLKFRCNDAFSGLESHLKGELVDGGATNNFSYDFFVAIEELHASKIGIAIVIVLFELDLRNLALIVYLLSVEGIRVVSSFRRTPNFIFAIFENETKLSQLADLGPHQSDKSVFSYSRSSVGHSTQHLHRGSKGNSLKSVCKVVYFENCYFL
jgi:hypothetical protein